MADTATQWIGEALILKGGTAAAGGLAAGLFMGVMGLATAFNNRTAKEGASMAQFTTTLSSLAVTLPLAAVHVGHRVLEDGLWSIPSSLALSVFMACLGSGGLGLLARFWVYWVWEDEQ